jgi:hypothetical protein
VRGNIQIQAAAPAISVPVVSATVQRKPKQKPKLKHFPPQSSSLKPAKLEGELNRALRNAGIKGITAEVGDDLIVTLKGSTGSTDDKKIAFDIARSFNGIRKVRDRIFVVW